MKPNQNKLSVFFTSQISSAVLQRSPLFPFPFCFQAIRQSVAIVRRFPFSSSLQRMSVVTVDSLDSSARCFLKGAPEMVASHCVKESGKNRDSVSTNPQLFCCSLLFSGHLIYLPFTLCPAVPSQFTNTLQEFASEGFRVLALAYKKLDAQTDLSSIKRSVL